jgi:hypothetical protein
MSDPTKLPKPSASSRQSGLPAPKNSNQPQDLKSYVQQSAVRGVAALLVSIGVPPDVANRIAPYVLKGIAVLVSFVFIMLVALVATEAGGDDVESTTQYEQLSAPVRALIEEIAEAEEVPSRLVIAIAQAQTQLGTSSPYEVSPRTEGPTVAVYPVVKPAIGSKDVRGQGLGMYLLRADAVRDEGINPQSWREATELVVKLIAEGRAELIRGGLREPVTAEEADLFWSKVVADLPLVDPLTGLAGCVGDPADIGNAITTVWRCEARRSGAQLYQVTPYLGVVRTSLLPTKESTAELVREALGVAWVWGSRNGAKTWSELATQPCNNGAGRAGIFPLTKEIAKKYDLKDRCDPIGNIRTAAQAVLDDLTVPVEPDTDRPYAPMLRGWSVFGEEVTGPGGAADKFAKEGPWRAFQPKSECSILVATWVIQLPSSGFSDEFANVVTTGNRDAALKAFDDPVGGAPRRDVRCVDPATGKEAPLPAFLSYAAAAGVAELTEITEASAGLSGSPSPATDGLISLAATNGAESTISSAAWGATAAVERLSPAHITLEWPFIQPSSSGALPAGLTQRVIGTAILYGGLVAGDDRAGENPYSGFAGDVFGSTGGIGISIDRQSPNAKPVIVDVAALTPLVCGTAGVPRYGLAVLAQRWETMCQAAKQDGVDLSIISAWRSMADQTRLYNAYKGSNGRVAKPGSSPHQKAQAVDVYLGSPDGAARNEGRAYAWMHSVVGCYDVRSGAYTPLGAPLLNTEYAQQTSAGSSPCGEALPIKRMQTYGLVPLCANKSVTRYETIGSPAAVVCDASTVITGSPTRQIREPWHLDIGEIVATAVSATTSAAACDEGPIADPQEKRNIAIAVKELWYCELAKSGFTSMPPRDGPGEHTASKWFDNYAEQVASEAVLVAYCESGFNPAAANGKYKGVFQMGPTELTASGADARLWADAKVNITAAAKLWISAYSRPNALEGWAPWAVVNTTWYSPGGNSIQLPVIGRFTAQPKSPQAGKVSGQPLPNWAIDPSAYWAPSGSCGNTLGLGKPMPEAPASPIGD